jgi:drug/metabolite transporter (DMT)-like permease
VGVLAFSCTAVTGRAIAIRHWPAVVTVGVPSTVTALVFGVIALVLFGPGHFHLLNLRWVVGVILIYGLTLSLGSNRALRLAYRHCSVATVSIWGSLTIVVAIGSAALVLGEPVGMATAGGLALLLAGVMVSHGSNPSNQALRRYIP